MLEVVFEVVLSLGTGAGSTLASTGAGGFGGWQPSEKVISAAATVPRRIREADFIVISPESA